MWDAQHLDDSWADDRLEALLDGDLPEADAEALERLLAQDDDWAEAATLAVRIQQTLRATPARQCPPHVTEAVMAEARREAQVAWPDRLRRWGTALRQLVWPDGGLQAWQPLLVTASLVLLVFLAANISRPAPSAPPLAEVTTAHTDLEVARALAEVKLAFAYVNRAGQQAGTSIRREVLVPGFRRPMQHALDPLLPTPLHRAVN